MAEKTADASFPAVFQEHDRQYMHIGTMVEFAFALVGKLDVINKHSFNDFKLRVGKIFPQPTVKAKWTDSDLNYFRTIIVIFGPF